MSVSSFESEFLIEVQRFFLAFFFKDKLSFSLAGACVSLAGAWGHGVLSFSIFWKQIAAVIYWFTLERKRSLYERRLSEMVGVYNSRSILVNLFFDRWEGILLRFCFFVVLFL
jgi:hypothetical protein